MSEKKIVVPEQIKIAMQKALIDWWNGNDREIVLPRDILLVVIVLAETFARALSNNPIVPTDEQVESMMYGMRGLENFGRMALKHGAVAWQRRMFDAPQPSLYDKLIEWVFERAPDDVDRIDIYSGSGALLASHAVGRNSRPKPPTPEPEVPEEIEVSDEMLDYINEHSQAGSYMDDAALIEIIRVIEAFRRGQKSEVK